MSKIGRKAINISDVKVEIKGNEIHYKGSKDSGVYYFPDFLEVKTTDNELTILPRENSKNKLKPRDLNREWGLHRALLANAISGARVEFEKLVEITGLGYKAAKSGEKLVFTLGYSHKIDFPLPKGVLVDIDRLGQKLTIKSSNKELLGKVCDKICALRRPEPYKGTGIKLSTEQIIRKAGKTK